MNVLYAHNIIAACDLVQLKEDVACDQKQIARLRLRRLNRVTPTYAEHTYMNTIQHCIFSYNMAIDFFVQYFISLMHDIKSNLFFFPIY